MIDGDNHSIAGLDKHLDSEYGLRKKRDMLRWSQCNNTKLADSRVMNPTAARTTTPWLSIGLLAVLLSLAPYVMTFAPYGPYYEGQALHAPEVTDLLYPLRVMLVLFGLMATVVAFAQFLRTFRRDASSLVSAAPSFATFFACAVVGWRSFPYWVMGVYQVKIGAFPPRDQDPKSMIPMIWIGELWRLPIMLLPLLSYVVLPGLAVLAVVLAWRRQYAAACITVSCESVALLFMLAFSPGYIGWLMD